MRKTILVLLLIMALCFTACTAGDPTTGAKPSNGGSDPATVPGTGTTTVPTTDPGPAKFDLWAGVEGDTREFALEISGTSVIFTVNRDGSARFDQVYYEYTHLSWASDEELKKLDAELGAFLTFYGTYEIQDNIVTIHVDLQSHMRYSLRGADAEAAKNYMLQSGAAEYKDPAVFDKGIVLGEAGEGTQEYVLAFAEGTHTLISATTITQESTTEIRFAEDGTYVANVYAAGVLVQVDEYSAEGELLKSTCYDEAGNFLYVEESHWDEQKHITTRTDEAGNVIYMEEYLSEEKDGMQINIYRVTENGVVTMLQHSEYGENITREYYMELHEDGTKYTTIQIMDHRQSEGRHIAEYFYMETSLNGQRDGYNCSVRYSGVKIGELISVNVFYLPEMGVYEVYEEYYQGDQIRTEIAIEDYVPADWEIPTWNPGE